MRPRHVIAPAALAGATIAALLVAAPAAAQTTPAALSCVEALVAEGKATAARDAALPALLEFSPNVYPGDKVPTAAQLPAMLDAILADPDLGGGARALVDAAVKLQAALAAATTVRVTACAPPTTTTPKPTTTTTTAPTTTPGPTTTTTTARTTTTAPPVVDNSPADQFTYVPNTDHGIATGGE